MSDVICCQQLSKRYIEADIGVEVLKQVDFKIATGESVAIIGASGSGKSTLLQLLGGLDQPSSGTVTIAGESLADMTEKRKSRLRNRYLGFIYQFHHLLPEFNTLENVCMPLLIRGEKSNLAKQQASEILEKVGLAARMTHRIGELSGGERQRVAIARALVTKPRCVLADEPTGNLDEKTADKVTELMLQLNQELQTSFVVVTHNQTLAKRLDRTLVLADGHLQQL